MTTGPLLEVVAAAVAGGWCREREGGKREGGRGCGKRGLLPVLNDLKNCTTAIIRALLLALVAIQQIYVQLEQQWTL